MRVTISHKKPRQEVIGLVEKNTNDMLNGLATGPVQVADFERVWNGSVMDFSFNGKAGFFCVPIKGRIEVTDVEVIVEADLPPMLAKLMPEEKIRAGIEGKVRGYLT